MESQSELLLQMTDIIIIKEKRSVEVTVQKKTCENFSCNSFRKVIKKLEIVLDILEQ